MMKISGSHLANLIDYGLYRGASYSDFEKFIVRKDVDLSNPDSCIGAEEYLKVLEQLISKSNNHYFGLHYGSFLNLKALGLILEISLNASGIEQAVFILQEYLATSFPLVTVSIKKSNTICTLELNCKVRNEHLKRNLLDTVFTIIYRELKLMLSNNQYPKLQLPYDQREEYSKFLGETALKGDTHKFILQREILKTEINRKRVKKLEFLLPKFLMMLDNNHQNGKFSIRVRNMILNMCCPELPTFELVAEQFPMSHRTIQRKLTSEGTSFRKITNAIKKELSSYLIKGSFLKTQDISDILGYSGSSAYLHAVNNWANS